MDTGPQDRLYTPFKHVTGEAGQNVNSATYTGYAAAVGCSDKYFRYPHYGQYQVYPAAVEQYGYMSYAFDNLLYHLEYDMNGRGISPRYEKDIPSHGRILKASSAFNPHCDESATKNYQACATPL